MTTNNNYLLDVKNLTKSFSGHSAHTNLALNDINFSIGRGETVGLLGANGSGKSTLLKIICGVLEASSGFIYGNPKIRALIELGTGLDINQSGMDNISFFLRLNGYSGSELNVLISKIAEFSELGDALHNNVKTYSSGMFVRLAYSMHSQLPCDLLVIDEALAVGDARFQHKCFVHLESIKKSGTTILFVSHAVEQIRQLCDRVLVLDHGKQMFIGSPIEACDYYLNLLFSIEKISRDSQESLSVSSGPDDIPLFAVEDFPTFYSQNSRYGNAVGSISRISLSADGVFCNGTLKRAPKRLGLFIECKTLNKSRLIAGFGLKNTQGTMLYGTNSFIDCQDLIFCPNSLATIYIEFDFVLSPGDYFMDIGICDLDGSTGGAPLDVIPSCISMTVLQEKKYVGDGFLELNPFYSIIDNVQL